MVALVVVADARVLADRPRRPRRCGRGRPWPRRAPTSSRARACRRSPTAGAARPRPSPSRRGRARRLVDAEPLAEHGERPGVEREVPLDGVEQLAVEVVERRRSFGHRTGSLDRDRSRHARARSARTRRRLATQPVVAPSCDAHLERRRCPAAARTSTVRPGSRLRTSAITSPIDSTGASVDRLDDVADVHARAVRPGPSAAISTIIGPAGVSTPSTPEPRRARATPFASSSSRDRRPRRRSAPRTSSRSPSTRPRTMPATVPDASTSAPPAAAVARSRRRSRAGRSWSGRGRSRRARRSTTTMPPLIHGDFAPGRRRADDPDRRPGRRARGRRAARRARSASSRSSSTRSVDAVAPDDARGVPLRRRR